MHKSWQALSSHAFETNKTRLVEMSKFEILHLHPCTKLGTQSNYLWKQANVKNYKNHFALKPCSTACFRPSSIHILSSWTAASHCKKSEILQTRKLWLKVTETQQNCKSASIDQWFSKFQIKWLEWWNLKCLVELEKHISYH